MTGCTRRTWLAALAAGLLASGATAQAPSAQVSLGHVWLYRVAPRSTPGSWQPILLDGVRRGVAAPGEAYHGDVPAGAHKVSIMGNSVTFDLAAGQHVFVRADADKALFGKGIYPVLVDPDVARQELASLGIAVPGPAAPEPTEPATPAHAQ